MKALLIIAAMAILYAAGPAEAAPKRAVTKAECAKAAKSAAKRPARARRRALLRRCGSRQLSKAIVSAGTVRVEFNLTRAEDPHNLWLVREDGTGSPYSFDEKPSGAVTAKSLALSKGRWTLFCSLTGHEAAGMRATLTVN